MARRLRAAFERPEAFRAEYERNIAKGGLQLRAPEAPELRELVEVELALCFADESLVLEGEVVHCAPAPEEGEGFAVAVQLLEAGPELRERIARHAEAAPAEPTDVDPADVDPAAFELELEEGDEAGAEGPRAGPERRSAPRAPAQVPARLEGATEQVGGHTRDLSEAGALISADGSALPVGGRVRLSLDDPEGGPPLEVEGIVARHVESEGTVAAVAVRFEPDAEHAERVGAFVEAAKGRARGRLAGGIAGPIEELGIVNLVQMLGKSSPRGTLAVTDGVEEGVVAFEEGRLRYARLGSLRGAKALARLLAWRRGRFRFHASVDPLPDEEGPEPLDGALLEASRQHDEASRVEGEAPPGSTRFRLDREALARGGLEGTTEEALCDLAAAGFTLRRMLDVVPEPDAEILAALAALEARGILLRAEGPSS